MKDLTLEEIHKKQKYYSNKLRALHSAEEQIICSSYNYENMFIHYDYGYMYVTWQTIEGDKVLLQGVSFTSEKTMYRDACYLDFDALKEWRIPMKTFREDSENGKIKQITKEEFYKELSNSFDGFLELANEHIKHILNVKNRKK